METEKDIVSEETAKAIERYLDLSPSSSRNSAQGMKPVHFDEDGKPVLSNNGGTPFEEDNYDGRLSESMAKLESQRFKKQIAGAGAAEFKYRGVPIETEHHYELRINGALATLPKEDCEIDMIAQTVKVPIPHAKMIGLI